MPRKSASSLTIIPLVPGQGRPEPPADLDELEARAWRAIVDGLPAHWVDAAGQLILRRLAAQAAVAERLEARLRELRAQGGSEDDEDTASLVAQHGAAAKIVSHLLTGLRSRRGPRTGAAPPRKPWEDD